MAKPGDERGFPGDNVDACTFHRVGSVDLTANDKVPVGPNAGQPLPSTPLLAMTKIEGDGAENVPQLIHNHELFRLACGEAAAQRDPAPFIEHKLVHVADLGFTPGRRVFQNDLPGMVQRKGGNSAGFGLGVVASTNGRLTISETAHPPLAARATAKVTRWPSFMNLKPRTARPGLMSPESPRSAGATP